MSVRYSYWPQSLAEIKRLFYSQGREVLKLSVVNIVSQLLLPVKLSTRAKQSNISLDKAVQINVGKIYILAPVFG